MSGRFARSKPELHPKLYLTGIGDGARDLPRRRQRRFPFPGIFRVPATGGAIEPVVETSRRALDPLPMPDGGGLIYAANPTTADLSLWWRPLDGSSLISRELALRVDSNQLRVVRLRPYGGTAGQTSLADARYQK